MLHDNLDVLKRAISIDYKSTKKRIAFFALVLINTVILVGQTISIIECLDDIEKATSSLAIYALKLQVTYKTYFLYGQRKRITKMHAIIKKYFWDTDVAGEKIQKKADRWFKIIKLCLGFHSSTVLLMLAWFCFFPLTSFPPGVKKLPTQISVPFNTNPSPLYEILYAFLCFSAYGNVLIILLFDFLFVYFCQHLIVQFELLKGKLENITNFDENLNDGFVIRSEEMQKIFMKRLNECIDHHTLLLEFGRNLKLFSSASIAIQVTTAMLTLINLGFGITKMDFNFTCLEMTIIFISFCVEMTLYCIHGSELEYQSGSVAVALYKSQWHLLQPRFRKHIVLALMNTQKEIKITALGVLDINNVTLLAIFRNVFSAITLLQSFEET